MSQHKTTKEERLLQAIALEAKKAPSSPIDAQQITQRLGFSEKQARKAINLLARGNLIFKKGDWLVELAPHGLTVSETTLGKSRASLSY